MPVWNGIALKTLKNKNRKTQWLSKFILGLSRFVTTSRFFTIVDLILLTSTNRQNTGSGTFPGRESIKHIIRLFSKAAWYIKPI